ncbi:chymotrypsin family serine protease [Sphingomonas parva]|uniref:hypothetical protein n=1 Tax=Sphingomonas parva TaxID=2555898 RepID=UPI00177F0E1C|nr:hypothetical protein [Sphingomonas parva]
MQLHVRAALAAVFLAAAFPAAAQTAGAAPGGAAQAGPAPVSAAPAPPAPAQPPVVQSADEALAQDAAEYARLEGVGLDEAMRRLRAQEESVAETDRIQLLYQDRLAGIAIEHHPDYRIVVLLTGRKKVKDREIVAGGMRVPIVFRTGARASRAEILAALEAHAEEIRASLPRSMGMGVDPRRGEFVLNVRASDADRIGVELIQQRLEETLKVPARVRVVEREGNASIEGGARVEGVEPSSGRRNFCTTGFVVTDGVRTGIVTAAHCPDTLTYRDAAGADIPLEFGGQWGWSFRDVQLHVSEAAQSPSFYADSKKTAVRTLTGARGRASTRAGDVVCHRGERSGYSCAEVELVDYAPPGALCGGPCAPSWVTVAGPTCGGGDSGGPVFRGTTAFGIVKGASYDKSGRCNFYYYMSTDYLPDGWSLLTANGPVSTARAEELAVLNAAGS